MTPENYIKGDHYYDSNRNRPYKSDKFPQLKRIEDYKIYRKEFPSIYKTITFQLYKYLLRGIISSLKNRNYKALKHLLKLVFFK